MISVAQQLNLILTLPRQKASGSAGIPKRKHRRVTPSDYAAWGSRMPKICDMRAEGCSLAEISTKYGVSAGAVRSAMREHGVAAVLIDPPPPEMISRACLCCGRPFQAPSRYLRLCGECKKANV